MIRMILLDLDGTLVDKEAAHRRYCEDFMRRHPEIFAPERRAADLARLCDPGAAGADRSQFAREVRTSYPGLDRTSAAIAGDYAARIARFVSPDPDVVRVVAELSGRYEVAIVTNGSSRVQRAKLGRSGLAGIVRRVDISGETQRRKPAAEAFLRPLEDAGCRPEEAVMVGDHEVEDMWGARNAGLRACWVSGVARRGGERPRLVAPDWTIDHVVDLPGVLQ